jgi:hypothetical protein
MAQISLDRALQQFESTEANLEKIRRLLQTASDDPDHARDVYEIWRALPKIDGWKPDITIYDFDDIQLMRFDAQDIGEPEAIFAVENEIASADNLLGEYTYRFTHKRMALIRQRVLQLVSIADEHVYSLKVKIDADAENFDEEFGPLHKAVEEIDTLLGSTFKRPPRWTEPPRQPRRLFGLSHAAIAFSFSAAK